MLICSFVQATGTSLDSADDDDADDSFRSDDCRAVSFLSLPCAFETGAVSVGAPSSSLSAKVVVDATLATVEAVAGVIVVACSSEAAAVVGFRGVEALCIVVVVGCKMPNSLKMRSVLKVFT